MTDDNCSDCGLAHHLHVREDGIYECPGDSPISDPLCELCCEPMSLHTTTIACPGRRAFALQEALSEYTDSSFRSESPDPLLLAPDKQLPQRHYIALRRSAQPEGVVVPLRRSSRLENRRRTREDTAPYPQAQTRRSSHMMAVDPVRSSRSLRMSLQDSRRSLCRSYENENPFLAQNHPPRRKSLQPHVLDRMVPVEDMGPIEGFQPFTELDPGQFRHPVTVREPVREVARPPFEFMWKPSVVVPAVGGMRVRVGQFERRGNPGRGGATRPSAADESATRSSSSGSEGYFTAPDWSSSSSSTPEHHPSDRDMPSFGTFLNAVSPPSSSNPQPEFVQGSSKSALPLQQQTHTSDARDTHPSSVLNEFPQFDALARHYAAVQNQRRGIPLLQPTPPTSHTTEPMPMPSAPTFPSRSFQHSESPGTPRLQWPSYNVAPLQEPFTPTPMPTAPRSPQVEPSHALTKRRHQSSMPGTLPGVTFMDGSTEMTPSIPERAETALAVDDVEDWATREPWEYIHRVLTSSTCPLVTFLKTPTGDIPAAAQGAQGADLHLQKMLIDNEHWLLIGPRDINLYEFGVRFQTRAATADKFVFRFGNLNWGADVNQIEDEVYKAVMESSRRGRGAPTALPAQFMAGAMGGFVVWYALSLM